MAKQGSLLPKEITKAVSGYPENQIWLLYGPPKVGKTTLAVEFPKPLVIDLEGGAHYIDCYRLNPKNGEALHHILDELALGGHGYKTLVIDTIDIVNDWVERFVCGKKNQKQMGEGAYGSDWAMARDMVLSFVEKIRAFNMTKILIAHSKLTVTEDGKSGVKTIDLPGKLARFLSAKVDIIGYLYGETEEGIIKRKLAFLSHEGVEAGTRVPELDGKIINLEKGAGYKAILGCFEGNEQGTSQKQANASTGVSKKAGNAPKSANSASSKSKVSKQKQAAIDKVLKRVQEVGVDPAAASDYFDTLFKGGWQNISVDKIKNSIWVAFLDNDEKVERFKQILSDYNG
jgi:hypothetical protein